MLSEDGRARGLGMGHKIALTSASSVKPQTRLALHRPSPLAYRQKDAATSFPSRLPSFLSSASRSTDGRQYPQNPWCIVGAIIFEYKTIRTIPKNCMPDGLGCWEDSPATVYNSCGVAKLPPLPGRPPAPPEAGAGVQFPGLSVPDNLPSRVFRPCL